MSGVLWAGSDRGAGVVEDVGRDFLGLGPLDYRAMPKAAARPTMRSPAGASATPVPLPYIPAGGAVVVMARRGALANSVTIGRTRVDPRP